MNIVHQFPNTVLFITTGVLFNVILPAATVPAVIIILLAVIIFVIMGVLFRRRYKARMQEKQHLTAQLKDLKITASYDGNKMSE